jgi:ABC-2 type transport system permease protein
MSISMRKFKALFKKDLVDFMKNPALSVSVLLPIAFVVLYKFVVSPNLDSKDLPAFLLNLGMLMNSSMCGVLIVSTSVAEEKEKFTLRTLMLSNVSAMEFFLSKIMLAMAATLAGNVVIFFLAGEAVSHFPVYLLATILGTGCVIMISAVIGLVSRDQTSCSLLQIPVMLLFLIPPAMAANAVLQMMARLTPLGAMLHIYYNIIQGRVGGKTVLAFAVIIAWLAGAAVAFKYFYKKKNIDN